MIDILIRNIILFLILILIQGFLLINVTFADGLASPYLYILFVLLLPVDLKPWLVMIISILTGLAVDIFYNSIGIHASACVFLALLRPQLLKNLQPRDGYDTNQEPLIRNMGVGWFLTYAGILSILHHTWLLFFEAFSLSSFFNTFLKAILSAAFTLLLMIILQYLFYRRAKY